MFSQVLQQLGVKGPSMYKNSSMAVHRNSNWWIFFVSKSVDQNLLGKSPFPVRSRGMLPVGKFWKNGPKTCDFRHSASKNRGIPLTKTVKKAEQMYFIRSSVPLWPSRGPGGGSSEPNARKTGHEPQKGEKHNKHPTSARDSTKATLDEGKAQMMTTSVSVRDACSCRRSGPEVGTNQVSSAQQDPSLSYSSLGFLWPASHI